MPTYSNSGSAFSRPGKVVSTVMLIAFGLWLAFAVGTHWAGVSEEVVALLCGNTLLILHGQIWRLITAPLVQDWHGPWGLVFVLFTLYFFGVPLEERWGGKRFVRFLIGTALVGSLFQVFFDVALPLSIRSSLGSDYWYGGMTVGSGLCIAWALHHSNSVVRLYGILPITARGMIGLTLAYPLLYLIFRNPPSEGIPALYGGAFAGWLLGGGTPSPLRRYWLKFRINRLDAEVAKEAAQRKKRVERSRLKVVEGGLAKTNPASTPDASDTGEKGRGPDGRWLN
jgi:membrane associated rhomboid family serine protease